ncbi:MAG: exopolyphosphatase [Deltaproteobacteria bacterium]|nr:exopolyphosphatase [Deltaproteobacteria bacterium]
MSREIRFAAIDIGSNAIRLLLSSVITDHEEVCYKKGAFVRMPVRLGEDAFITGEISDKKIEQLEQTMMGFKHLMDAYSPLAFRACATSAMREASNSKAICIRIKEKTGINIDVIEGKEEAEIIFGNNQWGDSEKGLPDVFIDVGGGSTEISILKKDKKVSRSFNIGTIRLIKDMVNSHDWDDIESWVKQEILPLNIVSAKASGGNIHKILSLSGNKKSEEVTVIHMRKVQKLLESYNITERIMKLGLKPDRADVILPALKIYYSIMKWGNFHSYKVPQMGLSEGLVRQLYRKNPH